MTGFASTKNTVNNASTNVPAGEAVSSHNCERTDMFALGTVVSVSFFLAFFFILCAKGFVFGILLLIMLIILMSFKYICG